MSLMGNGRSGVAGNQLTALLRDHIRSAADLVLAAKAGDNAKVESASVKWYANADDIAVFLHHANPSAWPLDTLKAEMKMHLDLTLAEAVAHLKGDYAADVAGYAKVHEHILGLADALSAGIVNQFPERVGGAPGTVGMPRTGEPGDGLANIWLGVIAAIAAIGGGVLVMSGLSLTSRKSRIRR